MIFDTDGSFIENKLIGERIALKRKNGTFVGSDDAMEMRLHAGWRRGVGRMVGVCAGDVDKDDENMKIEVEAGRKTRSNGGS